PGPRADGGGFFPDDLGVTHSPGHLPEPRPAPVRDGAEVDIRRLPRVGAVGVLFAGTVPRNMPVVARKSRPPGSDRGAGPAIAAVLADRRSPWLTRHHRQIY